MWLALSKISFLLEKVCWIIQIYHFHGWAHHDVLYIYFILHLQSAFEADFSFIDEAHFLVYDYVNKLSRNELGKPRRGGNKATIGIFSSRRWMQINHKPQWYSNPILAYAIDDIQPDLNACVFLSFQQHASSVLYYQITAL